MLMIAHRGLVDGPNDALENHPDSIRRCLARGLHAEIDVWYTDHTWMLGHDRPQYLISYDFINQPGLWIHAKSPEASAELVHRKKLNGDLNFFWHQHDDRVLTSQGHWWTEPGKQLVDNSIAVLPELVLSLDQLSTCVAWPCIGICSDYINLLCEAL